MQSSWVFVYDDAEFILPKLELCLGILDMRMQRLSCQRWYFVWVFGYENAEFILSNMILCCVFGCEDAELILPKLVLRLVFGYEDAGAFPGFLDTRMKSSSYQSWYFAWVFGFEYTELILP